MRFTIYKNSVLATICSMFGAAFIILAITSLIGKELEFLPAIGVIIAGAGLMWLGSIISERKARKKQAKAASQPGTNAAKQQNTQNAHACSCCGHVNSADSRFCAKCGSPVSKPKPKPVPGTCLCCGHVNSADSRFCAKCGSPVSKPKPVPGTCLCCGHVNSVDSRFCAKCGNVVPKPTPVPGTCSGCGHVNSADSRFCAKCGRPIA